jgi:hypothetical protein
LKNPIKLRNESELINNMTLKDDGNKRKSKKSKKDSFDNKKEKKCRCTHCNEKFNYSIEDIIHMRNGTRFVTCVFCNYEVELK